jgi:hypothetical protein
MNRAPQLRAQGRWVQRLRRQARLARHMVREQLNG